MKPLTMPPARARRFSYLYGLTLVDRRPRCRRLYRRHRGRRRARAAGRQHARPEPAALGTPPGPGAPPTTSPDAGDAGRRSRRGVLGHAPADRRAVPQHGPRPAEDAGGHGAGVAERAAERRRAGRPLHQQRRHLAAGPRRRQVRRRRRHAGHARRSPTCATWSAAPTMDAACAGTFIENFGKRAFRRPLTAVEVERYKKVFMAGGDFANGIRLVVQTFLQSPKFVYLVEIVPADGAGKVLRGRQLVGRLAPVVLLPRQHARRAAVRRGRDGRAEDPRADRPAGHAPDERRALQARR